MDIRTLAEEIMEGRRIGRRDDLELFLECGLIPAAKYMSFSRRRPL